LGMTNSTVLSELCVVISLQVPNRCVPSSSSATQQYVIEARRCLVSSKSVTEFRKCGVYIRIRVVREVAVLTEKVTKVSQEFAASNFREKKSKKALG